MTVRMPRFSAALVGVALLGGLAGHAPGLASAASATAASGLPACRTAAGAVIVKDLAAAHRSLADWTITVLDTLYRLPSSYAPRDLVSIGKAGLTGKGSVRRFVIVDLTALGRAARAAGAPLAVQSAYRSFSTQGSTFAYWVRQGGHAAALRSSARAGHSEHQLGTVLDFRSSGGGAPWSYRDWGTTRAGAWMRANSWRFGFVMSYPKGTSAVTCYMYESWHFRYVGRTEAAAIHASGLTPREWMWQHR